MSFFTNFFMFFFSVIVFLCFFPASGVGAVSHALGRRQLVIHQGAILGSPDLYTTPRPGFPLRGARGSQGEPGGARGAGRSQEEPGGARSPDLYTTPRPGFPLKGIQALDSL